MTSSTTTKAAGGKTLTGVVVSNKMAKTVTVAVTRYVKHPKYGKFLRQTKRYLAHDEQNTSQVGQAVTIQETRPLSRHKHFMVVNSPTP